MRLPIRRRGSRISASGRRRGGNCIAKRAKNPNDPLKLVIVRDMWLTGFDAPCMHTMYVDKPMKGHGLMQAIARVNRVFRDKPAGLVVDYIGIAQNLKSALGQYSPATTASRPASTRPRPFASCWRNTRSSAPCSGPTPRAASTIDRRSNAGATPQARLAIMAGAIDWVLTLQQADAAKETTEEGKKRAHRRYADAVVALSKAFALAAASDEAREIREEVGFFQAIRAALVKSVPGDGKKSAADRELAIQQIVSRAVVSTEIVDIMKAAGLESPDISILSDEFLAEVRDSREEEPRHRGAEEADQRRRALASQAQRHPVQGLLGAAGGGDRPLSRQRHHDGAGARRTDPACQGHPGGTRARRGNGPQRRRDRLLRRAGRKRERAAGDGRTGAAGDRARVGDESSRATSRWTGCTGRAARARHAASW